MSLNKVFLDIKNKSFSEAQVVIAPFGFEKSITFGQGTKNGPEAIIKASAQVELFDEELWQETFKKVEIRTLPLIKASTFPFLERRIKNVLNPIIAANKLPIVLGGEHSITPFVIKTFKAAGYDDFSILQFDAHADLRNGYMGEKYSHASAMRRCLDIENINLVQIGIRNISNENGELIFWKNNQKRIKTYWAKDKKTWEIKDIIKFLKKDVYLTFDVDFFDSAVMPSTGTPEPGGLDWYESLDILRAICDYKKIIGVDFVEFAPIKNLIAPDFLAAKLIYKTIGYIFRNK